MPYRLSALKLNRVDLCAAGANPGAEIVLFKSQEGRVPQKAAKKPAAKKTAKADSRSKQKQRGAEEDEEEEDDELVTKSEDGEDDEDVEEDVVKSDEDDDDDDVEDDDIDEDEDEGVTAKSRAKKPTKTAATKKSKKPVVKKAKVDDGDEGDEDDADEDVDELDESVLKSLPASVRKSIERSQRIAKQAIEMAEEERDRRLTAEAIEKAKKDFPNLPGSAQEKGAVVKAIAGLAKEVRKTLIAMLKSGDTAVRSLMAETGQARRVAKDGGESEGQSAYDVLCEKRDELLEKDKTGKLTAQQAMAKAIADNPKIYAEYRVEKRKRNAEVN